MLAALKDTGVVIELPHCNTHKKEGLCGCMSNILYALAVRPQAVYTGIKKRLYYVGQHASGVMERTIDAASAGVIVHGPMERSKIGVCGCVCSI